MDSRNSRTGCRGRLEGPSAAASASLGPAGFRLWVLGGRPGSPRCRPGSLGSEDQRVPGRAQGAVASPAAAVRENQAGRRSR